MLSLTDNSVAHTHVCLKRLATRGTAAAPACMHEHQYGVASDERDSCARMAFHRGLRNTAASRKACHCRRWTICLGPVGLATPQQPLPFWLPKHGRTTISHLPLLHGGRGVVTVASYRTNVLFTFRRGVVELGRRTSRDAGGRKAGTPWTDLAHTPSSANAGSFDHQDNAPS